MHGATIRSIIWVCICNLMYPACNAPAPYYIICGLPHSATFSHIFSQTARFMKESYRIHIVWFNFLYKFVWNISHSIKNWVRYDYTGCPTRYRNRHFFNNFTTNENIATKFEADLPLCVKKCDDIITCAGSGTICVQTGLNPARRILESPC